MAWRLQAKMAIVVSRTRAPQPFALMAPERGASESSTFIVLRARSIAAWSRYFVPRSAGSALPGTSAGGRRGGRTGQAAFASP
eukprot:190073-Pyramimonas_sp.AAC.1